MIALHPNIQSSARWHGRRVGTAQAAGDKAGAAYELAWYERLLSICSTSEAREAAVIFDVSRRAARWYSHDDG